MNHAEFEAVVQEAMDSLPDWVHEALEHIEIVVADEPGDECEPGEEDLLGLYVGTPLTERSLDDIYELPDIIYIYRRPHLEMDLPPDELREEIAPKNIILIGPTGVGKTMVAAFDYARIESQESQARHVLPGSRQMASDPAPHRLAADDNFLSINLLDHVQPRVLPPGRVLEANVVLHRRKLVIVTPAPQPLPGRLLQPSKGGRQIDQTATQHRRVL